MIDLRDAETIPKPTVVRYDDWQKSPNHRTKTATVAGLPEALVPRLADILSLLDTWVSEHERANSMADDLLAILEALGH